MLGGGLHHDLELSPVLRARRRREYRPLGHDRWPSASAHPRQRQPAGDYAHDHPSGYERRRFLQELSARAPGIVSLPAVVILFLHSLPNCRGATPDFGPHYIRMCAEGTASPPGKNPSRFGNRRVRSSLGLQQSPLCPVVLFVDDLETRLLIWANFTRQRRPPSPVPGAAAP